MTAKKAPPVNQANNQALNPKKDKPTVIAKKPPYLGKRLDIQKKVCPFCKVVIETWGFDKLRKRDGKLVRYSKHSCPNVETLPRLS